MLCSNCSNHVKPVVAFDIDGVLGDYHGHFTDFCKKYWPHTTMHWVDGPAAPWGAHHEYDGSMEFEEWLGLTKIEYREAKLAYRQGGNKRWLPVFPGASEQVRMVRDAGCDIWIATSRPWQRLDNVDPDTREWLRRHSIGFDGLLYGDDKYNQLCEAVDPARIVAVVDDLGYQCRLAQKNGLYAIQVQRPHNAADRIEPNGTLKQIVDIITYDVNTWKEKHG